VTRADLERFLAIQDIGCLACLRHGRRGVPCDIHHLLRGGRRRGHQATIGLCPWHHRGVGPALGLSLAHGSKSFHAMYGSDEDLLEMQNDLVRLYELQLIRGGRSP